MRLIGGKWSLDDGQRVCVSHRLILIVRILASFQRVAISVESGGTGVRGFIPDFGSGGSNVRHAMISARDASIYTCCKFRLKMKTTKSTIIRWK